MERLAALSASNTNISSVQLGPGAARVRAKHADKKAHRPRAGIRDAMEALEREMILGALRQHHGNQSRAARQLAVTRQALAHKLAKYKIRAEDYET
jgi:DNA-binding NtrC family response regulator